jgi:hypothetical protein
MVTPRLRSLRRRPLTPSPAQTETQHIRAVRELDQRHADGLTVTLEWDPESNDVRIRCEDERVADGLSLCFPVDPRDARHAFLHPFAYV